MDTNPLQQILSRRAEIAKKMISYEALKKEDAELEIAQRVLERLSGIDGSTEILASPGAETSIVNILKNRGGRMIFHILAELLPEIQINSLRSILSRMKSKGLITRNGEMIYLKENPTKTGPSKELDEALELQTLIDDIPA